MQIYQESRHIDKKDLGASFDVDDDDLICSHCSSLIFDSRVFFCGKCSAITWSTQFCKQCVKVCLLARCDSCLCNACFLLQKHNKITCHLCGRFMCEEHDGEEHLNCCFCECRICPSCSFQCAICEEFFCDTSDCTQECVTCDKRFCKDCFIECETCKKHVCYDCKSYLSDVNCKSCFLNKKNISSFWQNFCDYCMSDDVVTRRCECGLQVCVDCSVTAFQRTRCRYCI